MSQSDLADTLSGISIIDNAGGELTSWMEQYGSITDFLQSKYGVDSTFSRGDKKEGGAQPGSDWAAIETLANLAPIICVSDGVNIRQGIKVKFVVDEEKSDEWHTIQYTMDGIRVDSKLRRSKAIAWPDRYDPVYRLKQAGKQAPERYWWYWERVDFGDGDLICQLWVSRSCEKAPPRDDSDHMIHQITLLAPDEETGPRELRFANCLRRLPSPPCVVIKGIHVVEVN
ncbi:hypothetical protein QFC21_003231 [Naganishia friedmannii]|uniref:Uncharacterized protein n=1 Tax=Naganishia friedmannii TaxID=89922 RepID=A0ACC2VTC4_9TREE|nr:hypothetical protein QFC21_003231 [Naganishia friedmannii]